jgi:hypothetical protein
MDAGHSSIIKRQWKIINLVLDPELDYLQCFEERADQDRTIGNIYSSCQRHIQDILPRLTLSEPNAPLDCQVLKYEKGLAIANGDPVAVKRLIEKDLVHLSNWLGRGLPISDKAFRDYNRHPMIYLYWRIAYVVIPPNIELPIEKTGIEVLISLGTGEIWHLTIRPQKLLDCPLNEFLIAFIPSFLAEAKIRQPPILDFEYMGYYRHDWFNFYLFPRKHDSVDELIIETLVGDHPARLGRALHRVAWGGIGQDVPLSHFLKDGFQLLITPCKGRVTTAHTRIKESMSSTLSPFGYHRSIDGLVERLR